MRQGEREMHQMFDALEDGFIKEDKAREEQLRVEAAEHAFALHQDTEAPLEQWQTFYNAGKGAVAQVVETPAVFLDDFGIVTSPKAPAALRLAI